MWKLNKEQSSSHIHYILITSLFILISGNYTFGKTLLRIYSLIDHWFFLASVWAVTFCVIIILISFFTLFIPTRISIFIFLGIAAVCGYFTDTYGIVIDSIMINNTVETNILEASNLITIKYLGRLFIFAIVPFYFITRLQLTEVFYLEKIKTIGILITGSVITIALLISISSAQYASFFREHKTVRYFINPIYPVYSLGKLIKGQFSNNQKVEFKPANLKAEISEKSDGRELVIVVVGETARADHFSLNGYDRDTNPLLSNEKNIVSFTNVISCGTSTAISVPCIFSISPKEHFDPISAKYSENIIDIIASTGVSVLWRDNNSDSKGVANRVTFEDFRSPPKNQKCDHGECRDIGMLDGLQSYIDQQSGDILIILHQMGSHGPAYYLRYPPSFEFFKPSCNTLELSDCTQEEIINSYDNTIRYTDYFLSEVIKLLKNNSDHFEPTLFYVSDHGESLGENGVYLHGLPYIIAPKNQKHVAMLVWGNEKSDLNITKIKGHIDDEYTHDIIALSLLDLFEINLSEPLKKGKAPILYFKH